ncbi:MAG: hypothetical protein BGP06_17925 [Rhizobiales bacterium 65-9]|nr:hypothetical protein [Hyphomicrobiales bacterium]OJY34796.1 MAG: hypothetical protein BGP06_17925 [Rhizobiales bacterium 65-9]
MIGWIVRIMLVGAGVIAGWFVPKDDVGYAVIQFVVALVFIAAASAIGIYWPRWRRRRGADAANGE